MDESRWITRVNSLLACETIVVVLLWINDSCVCVCVVLAQRMNTTTNEILETDVERKK